MKRIFISYTFESDAHSGGVREFDNLTEDLDEPTSGKDIRELERKIAEKRGLPSVRILFFQVIRL